MSYQVLNDTVLVERIQDEATSEVEKNYQEIAGARSNKGRIVAVDPSDPQLIVGDVILFSEHAANDVELDGQKFLLLNRKQVYLKLASPKLELSALNLKARTM